MKKILTVLISLIMILGLTGCALVPSLDLTEEEQKIIAEYSAGLLLKYDKNYSGSLKKISEPEDDGSMKVLGENPNVAQAAEEIEEQDVMGEEPEFSEDLTAQDGSGVAESDQQYSDLSVAQALGLDGFDVNFTSCEVYDIYPDEQSDDLVFSLQAQNGMELMVLNFTVTNTSDSARLCDVLNSDSSIRAILNGAERVNANKTILLNDLGSYSDEIEGYGMVNTVLIFEVAKGTCANISSIDLVIKNADGSTTHKLY